MPTRNANPSSPIQATSFFPPARPGGSSPLYWRSQRKLPTGHPPRAKPPEAHVPPKRCRREGLALALPGGGRATKEKEGRATSPDSEWGSAPNPTKAHIHDRPAKN